MKAAAASSASVRFGGSPSTLATTAAACGCRVGSGQLGRIAQDQQCKRNDHDEDRGREDQHGFAPTELGDAALEQRRPDRAGNVLTAGDQGERGASMAVEPAADIDVAWGVDAADAEQADEQAVAEPQAPHAVAGGDHETDTDHRGPECHGPSGADTLCDAAHGDAADGRAEPRQRVAERGDRPRAAEFGGDLLQGHHRDEGRAERERHHRQNSKGDEPGGACLDAGHGKVRRRIPPNR